jgi:glutathione S-transferase
VTIQLYTWPRSSGARVQWALEELGLPFEVKLLDRTKGEHKAAAYLAINPNGKVPALVDDGTSYFESLAIMLHLGERHGVERGLWPAAGQDRADALSWTVWSMTELASFVMRCIYHGLDTPISFPAEERSKAEAAWAQKTLTGHLDMLQARLATREYIGGAFSLVDVMAASTLMFGKTMGVSLDAHPKVASWLERCTARPALARVK